MNLKSLAIGLVLGFAVGVATVTLLRVEPESAEPPTPETRHSSPETSPAPAPDRPPLSAPDLPAEVPALQIIRTGTPREIKRLVFVRRVLTDEEARALIHRLDAAQAAGDQEIFNAALSGLSKSENDTALRRLLDLFVDESLPYLRGSHFVEAFHNCDVPGIAAAARRRFEIHLASGELSWTSAAGWFDLIAQHGDSQDISWLLEREESTQVRNSAREAIARSSGPDAMAALEGLFREGKARARLVKFFGDHHPDRAFELIHEWMCTQKWEEPRGNDEIFRLYGSLAPADRIGEVRASLLALTGDRNRLGAIDTVQQISNRGLDATGFEPILETPIQMLERPAGAAGSSRKSSARYAVEYHPIMWSERSANALETAGYKHEAAKVRAKLRSPWKDR